MACKLAAVVAEQQLRYPTTGLQTIQRSYNVISLQALPSVDRHGFTGIYIDDGQRTEARPVLELVRYEVHAPSLISCRGLQLFFALPRGLALAGRLHPLQYQAFFLVQPIYQVFAHIPAFTVQQHTDLAASVAHSRLCYLSDTYPQLCSWIEAATVSVGRPWHTQNTARSPFCYAIRSHQSLHYWSAL